MKLVLILFMIISSAYAQAEPLCDVRPGVSIGVKVIEFAHGNNIYSKIPLKETTADALAEELISLQDMGVCAEKILSKRCILKFEKEAKTNMLTLYRGQDKWLTWLVTAKKQAQDFVKSLQRVGFCS
jgi:hypothetical protein